MRERVPMTDFARQWAEHVAASASPRMTDDQAERDFWHAFMTRKTYAPEPSALQVLERLRPLLRARGVETALEVGPGWGSYTLTLAELCREVACVDLSRDVLDFVLRAGAERGFHNLRAYHAKWEEFTPERTYDLVFGYNCFYRQEDLAEAVGVTRQTIISLENGKYNASLVLAHKLARYFSCTIEDIFLFDEEE